MSRLSYHTKRLTDPRYSPLAKTCLNLYHSIRRCYPTSVIDVGCSVGALLYNLEKFHPDAHYAGIDNAVAAAAHWQPQNAVLYSNDLNQLPQNMPSRTFQLIISFETAEHLHNLDNFLHYINQLCTCRSLLIFSAARPGQRGRGHINCHDGAWWINAFLIAGWHYLHYRTAQFHAAVGAVNVGASVIPDYYLNTLILRRTY